MRRLSPEMCVESWTPHELRPRSRRSIEHVTGAGLSKPSRNGLLVFDGDCAFCSTWVERLRAVLPRYPETIPYQWADLDSLGLSLDDVKHYAWYLTPTHQYAGHLAFSALLRSQPRLSLRFAGHLIATPPFSWAAALGYRFISRYRHLLPGGTPACALPRD
jgi:predicted DCC family thiol-disulfide oxidoreductase YuxK